METVDIFLNEDQVVDATVRYLRRQGYKILKVATTRDKGPDIISEKNGRQLWVEAKGDTSARVGSPRFGQQFNRSQAFDHCAKAFYVAVKNSQLKDGGRRVQTALALPDNDINHERIDPIAGAMKKLDILMFWVSSSGRVRVG